MTPIIPHRKEKPLTSLVSMGGGAVGMAHAGGGGDDKTYIDDVFHNELYTGNQTVRTLNSGIDLAGKGGMVWFKNREQGWSHRIWDTERGRSKFLYTADTSGNVDDTAPGQNNNMVASFDSNGVTIGKDTQYGGTNYSSNFVNWQFRKAKGFFDVVTYTGTATGGGQQIPHNLGSVPGCIMIKRLDTTSNWAVYHRGYNNGVDPWHYRAMLNTTNVAGNNNWFNDTAPTATHFSVGGAHGETDGYDGEYVAYLFAGGASTEATAKSVACNGSNAYLTIPHSSDLDVGTGDWTVECWFKQTASFVDWQSIFTKYENGQSWGIWLHTGANGKIAGGMSGATPTVYVTSPNWTINLNKWYHVAMCKSGTLMKMFVNGACVGSVNYGASDSGNNNGGFQVGALYDTGSREFGGEISNVRFTVGQALYTSSFRPSLDPLTTTSQGATASNVKLLLCNNSSPTGSTVTTSAITNNNCTASSNSPFDDPEGNKFGENEDQNLIKCGVYKGNGSNQDIDVGFEPQWVLVKNIDGGSGSWVIADDMRGAANRPNYNDQKIIKANDNGTEGQGNYIGMYSRGFKCLGGEYDTNRNGDYHVYVAIRRPDGLVGKPPSAGNEVYTQVYGTSDSTIPAFNSGFVTDFTFFKAPAGSSSWYTQERLHGVGYMVNSSSAAEADSGNNTWDFMDGYYMATGDWSGSMNWMWKRGAGFDVVDWNGNGNVRHIQHSLGQVPEWVIVKRRSSSEDWTCYHKGLNGGSNPSWYYIQLNGAGNGQGQYTDYEPGNPGAYNMWNREEPTSSHIAIGEHDRVNTNGQIYMALLFASANDASGNPISKVGYYTGNGSSGHAITDVGFQPRLLIVKAATTNSDWSVFDTTRGWASGNDNQLVLNNNSAQTSYDYADPTSTGFTINITGNAMNGSGETYIYYAHA